MGSRKLMGSRKAVPLAAEQVDALPARCRHCLFWELGLPRPDPRLVAAGREDELAGDPVAQKQAWCSARSLEGDGAGSLVRFDGRTAGYALHAPARAFAPRQPTVPRPSGDALLLATVWVEPDRRGAGIGRLLVQRAIREALRLHLPAVEAYGDRRFREASCVLPCTWLLHEGFRVHREHPRYPLLRLDTRRTARWAESVEHALDEVLGRLPQPTPQPRRGGVEPA